VQTRTNISRRGSTADWDAFWRAQDKSALREHAGVRDPAFPAFWKRFFKGTSAGEGQRRLIDIACGNGAVTAAALEAATANGITFEIHCLDCSFTAVAELRERFPQVNTIVSDAGTLPYSDGSFEIVVSQFGLEYGGDAAFAEAARIVAPNGSLTAITHRTDSAFHLECATNLSLVRAVAQTGLIPLAREAFGAGFDLTVGKINRGAFRQYEARLTAAVEATKEVLRGARPSVVRDFTAIVLRDIGQMYPRLRAYEPAKVFTWFDIIAGEFAAYQGRLASMVGCALDVRDIGRIADNLSAAGFGVEPPQALTLQGSGEPAGWILSAHRSAQSQ